MARLPPPPFDSWSRQCSSVEGKSWPEAHPTRRVLNVPTKCADELISQAAALLTESAHLSDGWIAADVPRALIQVDPNSIATWTAKLQILVDQNPDLEILLAGSDRYPQNLRTVKSRPALLFVEGHLRGADDRAVAIVGSRGADSTALDTARSLAHDLASRGTTIVSGLARGVDSAAHKGALEARGRTLAVMGTGIGRVFPAENAELSESIRRHGALISQFPPGYGPTKTTFPARNAVIAGLSRASVIVVAGERSGTRIEINQSLVQGRPVLLWGPLLGAQHWAKTLAGEPLVEFVESASEIEESLKQFAA